VGKRRLERAIAHLDESKVKVEVNWLPFYLDPNLPTPGKDKMTHYVNKFGKQRTDMMLPHMKNVGLEEGISFSYGGKIGNTTDSHRLVEFAKQQGKQDEIINKLFAFYFEQERDISDRATLIEAGESIGLNGVKEMLESDAFKDEVAHLVEQAYRQNVHGVPYFRINNRVGVSGAQEPEWFAMQFKRMGFELKDE